MKKVIDSKCYDEHILKQGLEYQINNYYIPKEVSMKRRIEAVVEALNPKDNERVLDIGCGVGTFAFHASKKGATSFGIDYSRESIQAGAKLVKNFNGAKKNHFLVGDAFKLPFGNSSFDKVVAADFVEHITLKEKENFLKEIYRVLKPEGLGIIFTPNGIREKIGEVYWKLRHFLYKDKIPATDLHFGLTTKLEFEALMRKKKFNFTLLYRDVTRPYLAKIPIMRKFLALNLLWKIKKI